MKQLFTLCLLAIGLNAYSQNMLSNGFGFMAAINGNTYQKTSNVGSQNFQFVAGSNDGTRFYAVNFNTSTIFIINSSTYAIADSFTGPTAYYITGYNEPNTLFARGNKSLLRYNTSTKSLTDSLLIGNPWTVEERPGTKEVWVTYDSMINVVSYASSLTSLGTIKISNNQYDNEDVRFTPKGSTAYKVAKSKKKIYKIDASARTIIDSIDTAPYAFGPVAVSADSSKLFATNFGNKIYIIDVATKVITDSTMTSNKLMMRLYHHPTRAEIWAVHHFADSVTVFNETTKAAVASFGIGSSPFYLAFATASNSISNAHSSEYALQVFPNPATQSITISMPESRLHDIQVYNTTGQQVATVSTTNTKCNIDISNLASGNYYLSVIENNELKKTIAFTKK